MTSHISYGSKCLLFPFLFSLCGITFQQSILQNGLQTAPSYGDTYACFNEGPEEDTSSHPKMMGTTSQLLPFIFIVNPTPLGI